MVPVPMARRLVRIPVLPKLTVSKAATLCASGGGAANSGPNRRLLRVFEARIFCEIQAPATPAEPASRNFLRSMGPSSFSVYSAVRRGRDEFGYHGANRWSKGTEQLELFNFRDADLNARPISVPLHAAHQRARLRKSTSVIRPRISRFHAIYRYESGGSHPRRPPQAFL